VSHLDCVMTTVVPKLSKPDAVPFKSLHPARVDGNSSASFARALKDADSSKAAVGQGAEVADNSARLRSQSGESETSAGAADTGDDLTPLSDGTGSSAGTGSVKSGDPEFEARYSVDLTQAIAADSANVAGIAAPLTSSAATPTAPDATVSIDGALTTEAATVLASGAVAKAVELAQAAALWANGGLKNGSGSTITNPGVDSSAATVAGELPGPAAALADAATSAKLSASALANVLSTPQGSTISGVMDPAGFAASGGGVGTAPLDSSAPGPAGDSVVSASMSSGLSGAPVVSASMSSGLSVAPVVSESMSSGLSGAPIGLGGASVALQRALPGSGQSPANNSLLNAGRVEASLSGVGAAGPRAASSTNSGVVSVASALAVASTARLAQSSALSDSVGLSTTAGSITGTLSVPMMSGGAGADLGGSALGTQTGGAGSESGASSGGSRSGSSNAFMVQAANPSEPSGVVASAGAVDVSARSSRPVGLGAYANAAATVGKNSTTNVARVVEDSPNQPPALDVNATATEAAVASDPRAAWRDLRSKWDQPIRANAPKG